MTLWSILENTSQFEIMVFNGRMCLCCIDEISYYLKKILYYLVNFVVDIDVGLKNRVFRLVNFIMKVFIII